MDSSSTSTGILLFAHGSRVETANRGVHELARQVAQAGDYAYVEACFLDIAQPDLKAAIEQAAERGLRRLIVIPFFLTMGVHLQRDLPRLVAAEQARFPGLRIEVGESLEAHPRMAQMVLERIQNALGDGN